MMELTILERIKLQQLVAGLPGSFATLKSLRQVETVLLLDADEVAEHSFVVMGDRYQWTEKGTTKNVEIPDPARKAIEKVLTELDQAGTLQPDQMSLWEKFFPEEATP